LAKMRVTEKEMEMLKSILNGSENHGFSLPAIGLARLWRERGVEPSEFELESKEKFPLPLSSPTTPSLTITPAKENSVSKERKETDTKKKRKLSVDLILGLVLPDLTLRSPSFLSAWQAWIENRLQLRNPTLGSFEEHMRICKRLGEARAISAIRHSIASCYLTIYEPKSNYKPDNRDRVGGSL
jgi:hypothetical protein